MYVIKNNKFNIDIASKHPINTNNIMGIVKKIVFFALKRFILGAIQL